MRPQIPIFSFFLLTASLACHVSAAEFVPATAANPAPPEIAPASNEGEQAIANIKVPAHIRVSLAAAEPLLANPVAFAFDNQGRLYVCETFRQKRGVEDNRSHGHWLDDDLAARTIEDRQAYIERHLGEKAVDYTRHDDRIRLLTDRNRDGIFDKSTVFADGFNELLAGTGAGVLPYRGNVYYTNIPHLWMLRDTNSDGRADERKALHSGYGVRFAFRGHDMHGLTMGHDGKIYFSIGDRGLNVKTADRHHVNPNSGAVLRCNPDGSDLEMIHTGLRNPQELAFDDHGNLFTGDNNSDSGDKARWVMIAEGADSGWRMEYQYFGDRGPWNREKLWHTSHDGQAAYIVPPIAHIGDGPSGLTYYPGTGMGDEMKGRFLLADFRGTPNQSGIRSFQMKPKGAFFELINSDQPIWQILATDVDFGPDGAIYISDWVDGWEGIGKGRLYRFEHVEAGKSAPVRQVRELLTHGLKEHSSESVAKLLAHADRRIRLMAQFELVNREEISLLVKRLEEKGDLLARLHALWGLGQFADQENHLDAVTPAVIDAFNDDDDEVRAQAASLAGNLPAKLITDFQLDLLLRDASLRVRYFAALAVGKRGTGSIDSLIELIETNHDTDPMLRHAGIMALAGVATPDAIAKLKSHPALSVRLAAVVALRKHESSHATSFLKDSAPLVVLEAARAIHDVPIASGLPELAAMIDQPLTSDALIRRVLNANFRLGKAKHAAALAEYSVREEAPEAMRLEAIDMLSHWTSPSPKDRVINFWRPLPSRDIEIAKSAVTEIVPRLITSGGNIRDKGLALAAKLGISAAAPSLRETAIDVNREPKSRAAALLAFVALKRDAAKELAHRLVSDQAVAVRAAARSALVELAPGEIHNELSRVIREGEIPERQAALADVAEMEHEAADVIVVSAVDAVVHDKLPPEVILDVLKALEARLARNDSPKMEQLLRAKHEYESSLSPDDSLARHRPSLHGGDANAGKLIFHHKTEVSCLRCHKVNDSGGEVGPDLSKIASEKDRRYLLEAIVLPNARIAKNFETAVIADEDGKIHSGIVRAEDDKTVTLITAENQIITLDQEAIVERKTGSSAMPADLSKQLSSQELRDLIEFLSTLK